MYISDFQGYLKRLNPLLYVNNEKAQLRMEGHGFLVGGIYLRKAIQRRNIKQDHWHYADSKKEREFLEASHTGKMDKFVTGLTVNHIPEFDYFDKETGKLLARGYRTILQILINKRLADKTKVKQVFRCSSLGEADYDKLTLQQRWQFQINRDRNR